MGDIRPRFRFFGLLGLEPKVRKKALGIRSRKA